jgi:hypothetical protein
MQSNIGEFENIIVRHRWNVITNKGSHRKKILDSPKPNFPAVFQKMYVSFEEMIYIGL